MAVLSLPELDYLVELLDEAEDSTRIVKERGRTPNEALRLGLLEHGARESRHLPADELLRITAIVGAGKRTAQGPKGVELDNLSYQHDCFRHAGVKHERLDVARHHRDVTRIWAFVPAHRHADGSAFEAQWVEARCGLLARLRFVSEHELAIATRVVRERLTDDNRKRVIREAAIAEVLLQANAIEELAVERMRSVALGEVALALPSASPSSQAPAAPAPAAATSVQAPPPEDGAKGGDPFATALRDIEASRYTQHEEGR